MDYQNFFIFKVNYIHCVLSLKESQNLFIQSLPLYTSCLFSMLLNDDLADIEKPGQLIDYSKRNIFLQTLCRK